MSDFILAQSPTGFSDKLETVIFLLVIAGSILAPIAKKLIEAFSARRADSKSREPQPSTPRPVPPHTPVARPLTPTAAPPIELEEILSPPPPHGRPATGASRRRSSAGTARSSKTRRAAGTLPARRDSTDRSKTMSSGTESRLGRLSSDIEHREERIEEHIEDDVGHLPSSFDDIARHPSHGWIKPSSESSVTRHVRDRLRDRRTLREVVLTAEILGPPLALRTPEEQLL